MGALQFARAEAPPKNLTLSRARKDHQRNPRDVAATTTLSDLYEAKGMPKKAIQLWQTLLKADPSSDSARINLATLLYRQREYTRAYEQFTQIPETGNLAFQAHNGAGACCFALKTYDLALTHYTCAIKLNNRAAVSYVNMTFALVAMEKFTDAMDCTRLAYTLSPQNASILSSGADLLLKNNAIEQAITLYLEYLALAPSNAQAFSNLGTAYRALGRFTEAQSAFQSAISLDKTNPTFLYNLSTIAKAPIISKQAKGVTFVQETPKQRACFHFAMAHDFDLLQDYEQAFQHFDKGNANLFAAAPQSGEIKPLDIELQQTQRVVPDCPSPIFVIGMPRSGTTLVERLLSAHRQITAAGERSWLKHALMQAFADQSDTPEGRAYLIAERYSANIPNSLKQTPYFTDKMPLNFRYVKEAALAFPKAKFVHVHRDARAVAWSNFRTYFTIGGADMGYATQRDSILKFMQAHQREVASWHGLPKGRVLHLDYEQLVRAPKEQTAQLIAALGLPQQDDCSTAQADFNPVRTASAAQARRAIYQGSSQSWQNYQSFAPTWFDALETLQH